MLAKREAVSASSRFRRRERTTGSRGVFKQIAVLGVHGGHFVGCWVDDNRVTVRAL